MKYPITGVILAGGNNTRLPGKNKALIKVGDEPIIYKIYNIYKDLFDEIIIVTNEPALFIENGLFTVTDIFNVRSSLTGIHSGLFYSSNKNVFFSACDTPFLKKFLVETILEKIENNIDVVIPETSAGREPLCAVYSKNCLKPIEMQLLKNDFKIQNFFKNLRIKKINEDIIKKVDPEMLSFLNINTQDDLERALQILPKTI